MKDDQNDFFIVKESGSLVSKGSDTPSKEIDGNFEEKILILENNYKKALKAYTRSSLIFFYYKKAFLKICPKEYEPLIKTVELSSFANQVENPLSDLIKENKNSIVQNQEVLFIRI